jgi:hypothetical protein
MSGNGKLNTSSETPLIFYRERERERKEKKEGKN